MTDQTLEQRARGLLASEFPLADGFSAVLVRDMSIPQLGVVDTAIALRAIVAALQAQQPGAQAVAWALEQGGILADWCNTAGDALRSLMGAYERRVRSACTSSADLDARPWRCAEYVQAEDALAIKPTPSVLVGNGKSDTHPQPPSIPEPSDADVELAWSTLRSTTQPRDSCACDGDMRAVLSGFAARLRERVGQAPWGDGDA